MRDPEDLQQAVAKAWRSVLGDYPTPVTHMAESGASSLDVVRLQIEIEEQTGVLLDVVDVFEAPTFHALVELVVSAFADARGA